MPLGHTHPTFSGSALPITVGLAVYAVFGAPVVSGWVLAVLRRRRGASPTAFYRLVLFLQAAQAALVVAVVAVGPGRQATGLILPRADRLGFTLVLTVGAGAAAVAALRTLQRRRAAFGRTVPQLNTIISASSPAERRYAAAAAAAAAVGDELLYRGLLTAAAIGIAGLSDAHAVLASSAVFVVAQAQWATPRLIPAAGVSLLIGLCYLETSSLLLPIVLHAAVHLHTAGRSALENAVRAGAVAGRGRLGELRRP